VTPAGSSRVSYIAASVSSYANFSVSLWIYPTFLDISNTLITVWSVSPSLDGYSAELALDGNGRNLAFLVNNDSNNSNRIYGSVVSLNTWYHVVCTYNSNSNRASMYLNGSLIQSTIFSLPVNSYNWFGLGARFGQTTGTSAKGFRGAMCFVNMFDKAISSSDVAYLYNNPGYNLTTTESGLMTIGIENESGYINNDRIALWPGGGQGFVGINTRNPLYILDVSGTLNTNADATMNGVSVGRGSGNVATNTVVGYQTLKNNTTGIQNVALGYIALTNNVSGSRNTAIGDEAATNITTQDNNTAIGHYAGSNPGVGGSENTFLGAFANLGGNYSNSTAVGYNAQITASNQIVLGRSTEFVEIPGAEMRIKGTNSRVILRGINDTTGNSFVLCNGLNSVLSQNFFGIALESAGSGYSLPFQINLSGVIGIGYSNYSVPSTSGYLLFVNSGVQATQFNAISDYRVKENVVSLDESFTIDGLNPVTYNLKSTGRQDIGFIAHEVQELYPFLVSGEKDGKDTQSLNYNGFIGILTKEIKDLKKKVAEQEARIAEQEARIQALEKMVLDLINK